MPTALSLEWQPTEPFLQLVRDRQLDEAQIAYLANEFREYWTVGEGANTKKRNWLQTWRNNLDNQIAWKHGVKNLPRTRIPSIGATVTPLNELFFAAIDTPQWEAWDQYWHNNKGHGPPQTDRRDDKTGRLTRGYWFGSEFPPDDAAEAA